MSLNTYTTGVSPSSIGINKKYAYVCNSNNNGISNEDTITILNLKTKLSIKTIYDSSFNEPYRIAFNKKENLAYITNSASPSVIGQYGTVTILNTKTNRVVGVIEGFDGPTAILYHKNKLYVTNYGAAGGVQSGNGRTISVVDTNTNSIIQIITVDQAPVSLALSPCKKFLYCLNYVDGNPNTGTINVIRLKDYIILNTITGLFGPFNFVITNTNIAYVTNFGSNNFSPFGRTISVIDMNKLCLIKEIEVGIQPTGICLSSDEKYVYISNYNALYGDPINFKNLTYGVGTINIISTKTNKVISPTISIPQTPSFLVYYHNRIFATSYSQNIVTSVKLI